MNNFDKAIIFYLAHVIRQRRDPEGKVAASGVEAGATSYTFIPSGEVKGGVPDRIKGADGFIQAVLPDINTGDLVIQLKQAYGIPDGKVLFWEDDFEEFATGEDKTTLSSHFGDKRKIYVQFKENSKVITKLPRPLDDDE